MQLQHCNKRMNEWTSIYRLEVSSSLESRLAAGRLGGRLLRLLPRRASAPPASRGGGLALALPLTTSPESGSSLHSPSSSSTSYISSNTSSGDSGVLEASWGGARADLDDAASSPSFFELSFFPCKTFASFLSGISLLLASGFAATLFGSPNRFSPPSFSFAIGLRPVKAECLGNTGTRPPQLSFRSALYNAGTFRVVFLVRVDLLMEPSD